MSTIPSMAYVRRTIESHKGLPSIVLVHGAWQSPSSFALLVPLLENSGYEVKTPSLPSSNSVPAVPDFTADVKAVRAAVQDELSKGKNVVLVMHCYGAIVGCEALKGMALSDSTPKTEGVVLRLLFISGMVLPVGASQFSAIGSPTSIPGWRIDDNFVTFNDGPTRFYHDLPKPLAEDLSARLTPQSILAFYSPLTHAAYQDIPSSYLLCTLDRASKKRAQLNMIAMAGITDVVNIEAGHVPFADPEKVEMVAMFILSRTGERTRPRAMKL